MTGLYYYGARYYDPRTSIWLSVDPLVEKLIGRSPYEYCYNNPVKYLDPNGKYGSDGHYWTVYAMGISMGLSNEQALKYALHAENYDNVVTNTGVIQKTSFKDKYTWLPGLPGGPQQRQHGLTGGSQEEVNRIAHEGINSGNLDDLHLLGDSYAHATESSGYKTMYPKGRGHAGHNADNIGEHTNQYNKYLNDLVGVMGSLTGFSGELDRTVFDLVGKSKNADVRTDILKAFIASKVGQKYETDNYIKSGKINELKSALDELGIKYKESKVIRTSFIINDDN